VVYVTQRGVALTEEQQLRLFEAFYSTHQERLGLGLWCCREVLRAYPKT
jgi:signal transduction histidine kinase